MAGLDDTFMARFVLLENVGFIFLCQISRFYLGSMYESIEFQVLSGIRVTEEPIFWPIYVTIMVVIFGVAFGSITMKKIMEKFKDYKLQVRIQENFSSLNISETSEKTLQSPLFNNIKYNVPLLNGIQFGVLGTITFVIGITIHFIHLYVIVNDNWDDHMIPYQSYLYRRLLVESILFSFILPVMYLATKKDVLRFTAMSIKDVFC